MTYQEMINALASMMGMDPQDSDFLEAVELSCVTPREFEYDRGDCCNRVRGALEESGFAA